MVQSCGTGKSLVGFEYALQHPDKSILWLSPSDYIFEQQLENLSHITPHVKVSNVTQMTYATALSRTKRNTLDVHAEVIIIDEFHRAGARKWQAGVESVLNQNPYAKVIGMSATKYRYAEDNRDMAKELFGDNIVNEINIVEALQRHILPKPLYVRAAIDNGNSILRTYQNKVSRAGGETDEELEKDLLDLRNNIQNANQLDDIFNRHIRNPESKIIVFCRNEKHLEQIMAQHRVWFHKVNKKIHCYKTTCATPNGNKQFNNFKADNSSALKILALLDQIVAFRKTVLT